MENNVVLDKAVSIGFDIHESKLSPHVRRDVIEVNNFMIRNHEIIAEHVPMLYSKILGFLTEARIYNTVDQVFYDFRHQLN